MATLAVLSCQKIAKEDLVEEAAPVKTDRFHQALTFHASWANESASTRTAIQADGITVWWTTQESLNVFYGAAYSGEMVSTNQEPASHADFTGYLSPVENASESPNDAFWAVYPYNDSNYCDGQHVFLTVPGGQIASEGTFADKLFPAVARSIDQDLQFYNVCGGACFTVEASGIQAVTFVSRNGAPLAGRVQVTMDSNGRPVIEDDHG